MLVTLFLFLFVLCLFANFASRVRSSQNQTNPQEIEALSASKKLVAQLGAKEDDIAASKGATSDLKGLIAEKNTAINEMNKLLDAQKAVITTLGDKEKGTTSKIPDLIAERDVLRKEMNGHRNTIRKLRDQFKKDNNKWYEAQKEARAERERQKEEENKQREEEKAAWLKKKEEEELAKVPYEEEMELCAYLMNYLQTTFLDTKEEKKEEEKVMPPAAPVSDDPFAGMTASNKKNDEIFLQMGPGKANKKKKGGKNKVKLEAKWSVSPDTFEQFGLLDLEAPTALDQVEGSIKALQEKKEWYTTQERGAHKTASEKRREAEKKNKSVNGAGGDKKSKGSKTFNFNGDDFAPLGGGGGTTAPVSGTGWGKSTN